MSHTAIGFATSLLLHGLLFGFNPSGPTPIFDVQIAESSLEISLVQPRPIMQKNVQLSQENIDIQIDPIEPSEDIFPAQETSIEEEKIMDVGGEGAYLEAEPKYSKNKPPVYPRVAREREYEGQVDLDIHVNEKGRVVDVRVLKSSGYTLLDKAAIDAVKKWVFEPARRGDHAISSNLQIPILFRLENAQKN